LDECKLIDAELEVVEVVGVELVGDTDLGRGRGKRMEHGRDGRRESRSELVSA
jgi:hypothetical protein